MTRTLIIGGTGMLQDVTAYMVQRTAVTLVARDPHVLNHLQTNHTGHRLTCLAADYTDTDRFIAAIRTDIQTGGAYHNILCWMHGSGKAALQDLLMILDQHNPGVGFYHIKGSVAYNPAQAVNTLTIPNTIAYREIILGFQIKNGKSRWLTNTEIANGVINAYETQATRHVIGITEPWEKRP